MIQKTYKYLPWFMVKSVPGIGNLLYKRLLDRFKTPEKILTAGGEELASIKGLSQKAIRELLNCTPKETAPNDTIWNATFGNKGIGTGTTWKSTIKEKAKKELDAIHGAGLSIVTLNEPAYPPLLRQIPDPPPFFTYRGKLDITSPCISIVGSRNATSYGLESAYRLGYDLAAAGFQVVSGMARGIDTAAHKGALAATGKTIAILGSGLKWIYPRENLGLCHDISQTGTVISEFSPHTKPDARNFPMRNRIIAGISAGTVIVEAAPKSGSLITARLAADFSREVFAVPGNIGSLRSHGTHALIRQGATLIQNHRQIMEELHHMVHMEPIPVTKNKTTNSAPPPGGENKLNKIQQAIMAILEPYPLHMDKIVEKTDLDIGGISGALLDLELKGMVKQLPGKLFTIKEEQS